MREVTIVIKEKLPERFDYIMNQQSTKIWVGIDDATTALIKEEPALIVGFSVALWGHFYIQQDYKLSKEIYMALIPFGLNREHWISSGSLLGLVQVETAWTLPYWYSVKVVESSWVWVPSGLA